MTGTLASLLDDVIAVLAEALCDGETFREAEARHAARDAARQRDEAQRLALEAAQRETETARRTAAHRAAIRRQPMLPVAAGLARTVAAKDQAGTDALLARPRNPPEWRRLALALAAGADPARIMAAAGLEDAA